MQKQTPRVPAVESSVQGELASAWFVRELRRTLQQLYNPDELGKSPLVELLGVHWQRDPAGALQRLLLAAIAALKPAPEVPPQANSWRLYHTLNYHYVEQIPQRDIASSLALSVRQLRRQEATALRVLANRLWASHALQLRVEAGTPTQKRGASETPVAAPEATSREQEMERLRESFPSEATTVEQVLHGAIETIAPLLQAMRVQVHSPLAADLPQLAGQAIPTRQALVNILSVAIRSAPGGQI